MYTTKTQGTDNTNGSLQLSPGHTAAIRPMVAIDTLHLPPRRLQPHCPEDEVNSGKAVHSEVIYGMPHPRHISGTDTVRHFNLGPSTPLQAQPQGCSVAQHGPRWKMAHHQRCDSLPRPSTIGMCSKGSS